jgi:hypothetical protein
MTASEHDYGTSETEHVDSVACFPILIKIPSTTRRIFVDLPTIRGRPDALSRSLGRLSDRATDIAGSFNSIDETQQLRCIMPIGNYRIGTR